MHFSLTFVTRHTIIRIYTIICNCGIQYIGKKHTNVVLLEMCVQLEFNEQLFMSSLKFILHHLLAPFLQRH